MSYTCDGNGERLLKSNTSTGAAGYAYTYDADGNRVRKSSGSTGTLYWYMTPGIVGESDLSGNLTDEYVFFDGERVARKSTNGVFYYFSDYLKTASVITDSAGNIKSESDFYPWGGELQFVNNDSNHYKFTGKERDSETQLDYFGARYYSNGLGRWVSADWSPTPIPVPYADFHDPQSLNLYGFVGGNPASKADPDGHDALWVVDKQTGQTTLVIPVHFTASGATKENISAITKRDNELNTGGSGVTIQVVSTDKPINGVLNKMDLSPGKDQKYAPVGEGVNKMGGNEGHINTDNGNPNTTNAAAHDNLHFAGIQDQYKEGKQDANGQRTSTPTSGNDNSNIMTDRTGTKLKPQQLQEAQKNKSTKQCTSDKGKTVCH